MINYLFCFPQSEVIYPLAPYWAFCQNTFFQYLFSMPVPVTILNVHFLPYEIDSTVVEKTHKVLARRNYSCTDLMTAAATCTQRTKFFPSSLLAIGLTTSFESLSSPDWPEVPRTKGLMPHVDFQSHMSCPAFPTLVTRASNGQIWSRVPHRIRSPQGLG